MRFSRTELDSMLKYKYGESIHISGLSPIAGDHYYLQVDSRKTSDELAVMYTDRMLDGTYFSAGMSLVFSDINEEISDLNYFVPLMLGSDPDFPGALVNKVSVKRSSDEELWRYYATWYPNRYSYIKTEYSRGLNQGIALQGGAYLTYRMSVYASFVHGSGSHNPAKVTMAGLEYLF